MNYPHPTRIKLAYEEGPGGPQRKVQAVRRRYAPAGLRIAPQRKKAL